MTRSLRIAAAVAVVLISVPGISNASSRSNITCFSDTRAVPCGGHELASQNVRHSAKHRHIGRYHTKARKPHQRPPRDQAILIDKDQEYVKPTSPAEKLVTREAHEIGSGIVRSRKTGATARVSPRFAPIAQAIVDELERGGASIRFMGGYRRGPCASYSLHPCGLAIDLCQLRRGVVDPRCNLPSRSAEARIAAAHGALSGGVWCNQDRGHVQLGNTAGACGSNIYSAVSKFKRKYGGRRHVRLAAERMR